MEIGVIIIFHKEGMDKTMVERLQHKYALSEQGAKDMVKACAAVTVSNMVMMFPAMLLYYLIADLFARLYYLSYYTHKVHSAVQNSKLFRYHFLIL